MVAAGAVASSIVALSSLQSSLPQSSTNGNSTLGTLQAPTLSAFVSTPNLPDGFPWGSATASNTNPYKFTPGGGLQRNYKFNIARGTIAPDGVQRSVLLINDAFPAPTIEVNWGDTINVEVCNNIVGPEEGTALHWHGILQTLTPWYDGVPSVQQCPIAPGKCFTYKFLADLYGTTWYHSHYTAQYNAGLLGPLIIHGPQNVPYDIDVGPVLLTDWYHDTYEDIVEFVMTKDNPLPPKSNNNLINGKMNYDCSQTTLPCTPNAGLSKFKFQSGKKHRLRLINAGSEGLQRFTIDGHTMTVMANDFVPVEPYETTNVTLGIGQRTDVIVTATGPPNSSYWMRSNISTTCSSTDGISPNALAVIYYEDAVDTTVPTSSPTPFDNTLCANDDLSATIPFFPFPATSNPAVTQDVNITFRNNQSDGDGWNLFYMNNSTFRANYDYSILALGAAGNLSFPLDPEWNVYNFGTNSSIRLIVYNEFQFASHPMHLHGHNFNVLAEGNGFWDGTIVHQQNTQRRDVQIVRAGTPTNPGYIVLQYETDNPGVWPFHCHIAWHVSAGLYINTVEQTQLLKLRDIPQDVNQLCVDWGTYAHNNVVDEIDSGLKERKIIPGVLGGMMPESPHWSKRQ